eukprot:Phypoly_transcript_14489.p1 GENE.Phypoly_transcript_14489~~Phypoly_transcript_14489.p1  ORF type:complete len:313 (+),score=22.37 Phypoly_transcript_14489:1-939(+)
MTPSVFLSFAGSGFILVSFILFRNYRRKSPLHMCICCMAICDFMMMVGWWVPFVVNTSISCTFQAYIIEFFAQGTMVWTSIFAIRIYISNMSEERNDLVDNIVSHIFGWGISLVLCIFATVYKLFGRAGSWCWIDDSHPLEQIFMGDGLSVIMFAIELFVFVSLMYKLRSRSDMLKRNKRRVVLRFALFLAIPPICWGFGLANRLMGYIHNEEIYWLQVLQGVFTTSQGFLNAIFYGYDPELRALWISLLCTNKCFGKLEKEKKPLVKSTLLRNVNEDLQRIEVNVNNLYAEAENQRSTESLWKGNAIGSIN